MTSLFILTTEEIGIRKNSKTPINLTGIQQFEIVMCKNIEMWFKSLFCNYVVLHGT